MEQEDTDSMKKKLEKETLDKPSSVIAWRNYGVFLLSIGSSSEAEEVFLKALELDQDNLAIWIELGNSYMIQKKWKQAEQTYRTTVEKNLDYSKGWLNLGIVLARQGNMLDAEAAFDMYQYGSNADVAEEIELAKNAAEGAHIEENPEYAEIKENFTQITRQVTGIMFGLPPESTQEKPSDSKLDSQTLQIRAELLLSSGKFLKSLDAARRAVELNPDSGEAWYTLAKCLMSTGLFVKAIEVFSKADGLSK